jgi:hypothetical protein
MHQPSGDKVSKDNAFHEENHTCNAKLPQSGKAT